MVMLRHRSVGQDDAETPPCALVIHLQLLHRLRHERIAKQADTARHGAVGRQVQNGLRNVEQVIEVQAHRFEVRQANQPGRPLQELVATQMQFSQFRHVGDIGHGRRYLGPAARSDEVEVEVQHTQGRERAQPLGTFRREHDAIAAQVEARQPRHVGDPLRHGSQPVIGDGKVTQTREAAQEITGVMK